MIFGLLLLLLIHCKCSNQEDILERFKPSSEYSAELNSFLKEVWKYKDAFDLIKQTIGNNEGGDEKSNAEYDYDQILESENFGFRDKESGNTRRSTKRLRPHNEIYPHMYKEKHHKSVQKNKNNRIGRESDDPNKNQQNIKAQVNLKSESGYLLDTPGVKHLGEKPGGVNVEDSSLKFKRAVEENKERLRKTDIKEVEKNADTLAHEVSLRSKNVLNLNGSCCKPTPELGKRDLFDWEAKSWKNPSSGVNDGGDHDANKGKNKGTYAALKESATNIKNLDDPSEHKDQVAKQHQFEIVQRPGHARKAREMTISIYQNGKLVKKIRPSDMNSGGNQQQNDENVNNFGQVVQLPFLKPLEQPKHRLIPGGDAPQQFPIITIPESRPLEPPMGNNLMMQLPPANNPYNINNNRENPYKLNYPKNPNQDSLIALQRDLSASSGVLSSNVDNKVDDVLPKNNNNFEKAKSYEFPSNQFALYNAATGRLHKSGGGGSGGGGGDGGGDGSVIGSSGGAQQRNFPIKKRKVYTRKNPLHNSHFVNLEYDDDYFYPNGIMDKGRFKELQIIEDERKKRYADGFQNRRLQSISDTFDDARDLTSHNILQKIDNQTVKPKKRVIKFKNHSLRNQHNDGLIGNQVISDILTIGNEYIEAERIDGNNPSFLGRKLNALDSGIEQNKKRDLTDFLGISNEDDYSEDFAYNSDTSQGKEKRTETEYGEEPDLSIGNKLKKHKKRKLISKEKSPNSKPKNFEENYEYEEAHQKPVNSNEGTKVKKDCPPPSLPKTKEINANKKSLLEKSDEYVKSSTSTFKYFKDTQPDLSESLEDLTQKDEKETNDFIKNTLKVREERRAHAVPAKKRKTKIPNDQIDEPKSKRATGEGTIRENRNELSAQQMSSGENSHFIARNEIPDSNYNLEREQNPWKNKRQLLKENQQGSIKKREEENLTTDEADIQTTTEEAEMVTHKVPLMDGHFAARIVDKIFERVNSKPNLQLKISNALTKRRTQNAKNINLKDKSAEENLPAETDKLVDSISEVIDKLVRGEVKRKICQQLPPELMSYLKLILNPPRRSPVEEKTDERYHQDTFLFKISKGQTPSKETIISLKNAMEELLEKYNDLNTDCKLKAEPLEKLLRDNIDILNKVESGQHKVKGAKESCPGCGLEGIGGEESKKVARSIEDDPKQKGDHFDENGISDKYKKLVRAAKELREKRENMEKLGKLYGADNKDNIKDEGAIKSRNKEIQELNKVNFEAPLVYQGAN